MSNGGSPFILARCNTAYMAALDNYARKDDAGHDAIDALIANISGPALSHGTESS
jgi:hypothetical protein